MDSVAAARAWGHPRRENCGTCHYDGGGGNNVKHGDLETSLNFPSENLDVHMAGWICSASTATPPPTTWSKAACWLITPHRSADENRCSALIATRTAPHEDERINAHTASVACQTCHIPGWRSRIRPR